MYVLPDVDRWQVFSRITVHHPPVANGPSTVTGGTPHPGSRRLRALAARTPEWSGADPAQPSEVVRIPAATARLMAATPAARHSAARPKIRCRAAVNPPAPFRVST